MTEPNECTGEFIDGAWYGCDCDDCADAKAVAHEDDAWPNFPDTDTDA